MYPIKLSYTPADDDTDGFANDVNTTAGLPFALTATSAGDGMAHLVIITPSGSVTGDYTLTGTDADGFAQTEVLATNTVSAVTSVKYYSTLTEVLAPSGIGAETVDIGWTDDVVSPCFPLNWRQTDFQVSLGVDISGTIDFTVQYTLNQLHPQLHNVPDPAPSTFTWWPHADLTAKTADTAATLVTPVTAIRLLVNSLTAGATAALFVVQGN